MGESTRYLINNLINKREKGNSICVIFRGQTPAKNNTKKIFPPGGELFFGAVWEAVASKPRQLLPPYPVIGNPFNGTLNVTNQA